MNKFYLEKPKNQPKLFNITQRILIAVFTLFVSFYSVAQKKLLFDATKAETAANADWVIDSDLFNLRYYSSGAVSTGGSESNAQRIPTPAQSGIVASTPETYWTGALSSYGVEMVKQGYIVETLPWNASITFGDATNPQDLSNYAVYIVCEPNIMYTATEKAAILAFVNAGGGLYMLADHGGDNITTFPADRNNDGNSSIDVFNDLMNGNPFGMQFDNVYVSQNTTNVPNLPGDPLLHGIAGDVAEHEVHGSATMTLNTASNSTVKGVVYKTGSSNTGSTNCFVAYATYGAGRVVGMGDSSPAEDITSDPGDVTYDGWTQPTTGANVGDNGQLITNATIWLAGIDPQLVSTQITLTGYNYNVGSGPSSSKSFILSGSNLTGTQVTITAPTNYEVSTNNTTFSASVNVTYTAPTLVATTIYVRLKAGLAVGNYNSENVTCIDNGASPASSKIVVNSGTVSAPAAPSSVCVSENFDGTVTGWNFNSTYVTFAQFCSGTKNLLFDAAGDFAITPAVTDPTTIDFNIKRSGGTAAWSVAIQISDASPATQTSGPWTTVATIGGTVTAVCSAIPQVDLSAYTGLRYIKLVDTRASGTAQRGIDDVVVNCGGTPTPTITTSAAPTGFGNQCTNVLYSEKTFTVSGTNLTNNIILTPPVGFEISTTSGSGFVANPSTITLPQSGGTVATTTIYVRFVPTLVQAYSGNVTCTSTGATTKNVALSGTGIDTPPTISTPTSANVTTNSADLGGNMLDEGCTNVTAQGIYWSTTPGFTAPAGTLVSNSPSPFSSGLFSVNVTGLPVGTTIYYQAFATNSGGTVYTTEANFSTLKPEPTNFPTLFTCGTTTATTIPLTWTDAIGAILPNGYLIKWSSVSYASILDPIDGTPEVNGATTQNVSQGIQTYTVTSLTPSTTYYFKIWSYSNSGATINYKLIGEPQTSCTTLLGPCVNVGFEGSVSNPSGWTNSGAYYQNAVANAHSGTNYAGENTIGDWIRTESLTNPTSISFWCRASGATSSCAVDLETTVDGTTWVNVASYAANGSNTGAITTTYSQKTVALSSAVIAVRWIMTNASGSFYLDDVEVYCTSNTITTSTVSATPFTVSCGAGTNGTVDFTSIGAFTGNTYTAELSNSSGLFTSPTTIGTLVSDANSGTINILLPANLTTSSTYKIRVRSSSPSITGTNSSDFTITNSSPCTITPSNLLTAPFAIDCNTGAIGTIDFTSNSVYSGNTYTVQLSSASGSFTAPTNVGTLISDANSGTINFTIPAGTASGAGYLIRIISNNPLIIGSSTTAFSINLSGVCSAFEIQSILVDACDGGGSEGENEMFRFQVGASDLNTSDLSVKWNTNPWLGVCQNATTAATVAAINATITGGGTILEPTGGVLPANSVVMFFTSTAFNSTLFDFTNLSYTLYVVFQCPGNTAGHFGNYNATNPSNRKTILYFAGSGSDTVTYNANSVFNGDGGAVDFSANGTPNYGSTGGCLAPLEPLSVTLLDFKVKCNEASIELNWTTEKEINNKQYVVERSEDSKNFKEIAKIESKNLGGKSLYTYLDTYFETEKKYYRIKMIDLDGNVTYSEVKSVSCNQYNDFQITNVYYSENSQHIEVFTNCNQNCEVEINLYDVVGKAIYKSSTNILGTQISVNIPASNLKSGIYLIKLFNGERMVSRKIKI